MSLSLFFIYLLYIILFFIAQCFCMWGAYVTLPFKNLSMWEAYKMAIPFAWADWVFMTLAINLSTKYNLVTDTQNTFLLIIFQFILLLLINHYYLKKKIYNSDNIAFVVILIGYMVSSKKLITKYFGKGSIESKELNNEINNDINK